jgi:hypothetical protein
VTDHAATLREGRIPPAIRDEALRTIRDIAAGTNDLRAVRHPLGFLCFPVERLEAYGVCVHVWSRYLVGAQPTTSEMHAHSWDLLSLVLSGELHNLRLTLVDDEATHRLFEVHTGPDGDELRATSRLVGYRVAGSDVSRPGDSYSVGAGCFHATVASDATTIAVGMGRPGMTDLSLGAIDGRSHMVRREQCDRAATVLAARLVVEQLAEAEWLSE